MMIRQAAILLLTSTALGLAQTPPVTILQVELANYINYYVDVAEPMRIGSSPGVSPLPSGFNSTFKTQIGIGDIASINGEPAKGIWILRGLPLNLSPAPPPGRVIADLSRVAAYDLFMDILQHDGTHVGVITGAGMGGGLPPPGSPDAAVTSNLSITGGTGAFLGVRGQAAVMGAANLRAASAAEDPANRRLNGGGVLRMVVHLIPMTAPEVLTLPMGPAIYHASDFSPVSANRPARVGEMLILSVSGLGPVRPNLGPGAPFPPFEQGNLHEVNSPVSALVNGRKAAVVNKAGWPTLSNVYRVDFVVPDGTAPGMATLALSVAWINGPEVKFPVQ
jgi:hypothetical protein